MCETIRSYQLHEWLYPRSPKRKKKRCNHPVSLMASFWYSFSPRSEKIEKEREKLLGAPKQKPQLNLALTTFETKLYTQITTTKTERIPSASCL